MLTCSLNLPQTPTARRTPISTKYSHYVPECNGSEKYAPTQQSFVAIRMDVDAMRACTFQSVHELRDEIEVDAGVVPVLNTPGRTICTKYADITVIEYGGQTSRKEKKRKDQKKKEAHKMRPYYVSTFLVPPNDPVSAIR